MSRIPKMEIHIGYVCVNIFGVGYILQFCERRNLFCSLQQKSAFQLEFFRLKSRVSFSIKVKLFLIHNLCLLRDFTSDLILYNRIHLKNSGERSKFQFLFRLNPIIIDLKSAYQLKLDQISQASADGFCSPVWPFTSIGCSKFGISRGFLFQYLACKQNFYFVR